MNAANQNLSRDDAWFNAMRLSWLVGPPRRPRRTIIVVTIIVALILIAGALLDPAPCDCDTDLNCQTTCGGNS